MNIFQLKTRPHGNDRVQEFIKENFVCIGWPGIDNLSNVSKDEIRDRLAQKYKLSGHSLGNQLGQVNCFVNTMKQGDIVLITEKDWTHIGIIGDYQYVQRYDNDSEGMCHRRPVEWKTTVKTDELETSIQRLLNNRNTICQFPDPFETAGLEKHLNKLSPISQTNTDKLNILFEEALNVLEVELKSQDPERRLKAATELLRLKNHS